MASNVNKIIRSPGKLVVGPTDLAAAYPYGGTEIGYTKAIVVQSTMENFVVQSEGLGEPTDILQAAHSWVMSCFVRGWDDSALALFHADHYSLGAVTRHAVFTVPALATPGTSELDVTRKLLFVPDDVVNVPAMIAYRASPELGDDGFTWSRTQELGVPMTFRLLRGSTGKILQIGRLADLSVT